MVKRSSSVTPLLDRARAAFVVAALGWGIWSPCVCPAAPHEQVRAHCEPRDGDDQGLRADRPACCCDRETTLEAPAAAMPREGAFGPLHAVSAAAPQIARLSVREHLHSRAVAVVADSPPPRLIALRI